MHTEAAALNAELVDLNAFAAVQGHEIVIQVEANQMEAVRARLGDRVERYRLAVNDALAVA